MRELMLVVVRDACLPYFEQVLARASDGKHPNIAGLFDAHMIYLADYCMSEYGGRGMLTEAFICGLHKALFPFDYKQTMQTPEGEVVWMVPGEYKQASNAGNSYLYPNQTNVFIAPEDVPETMAQAVNTLNIALASATDERQKMGVILFFILDFLAIHPFGDANGRIACILADLLAIKQGLPAFYFHRIKGVDLPALYRAVELGQQKRDLTPLYDVIERYNPAALA